MKKIEVTVGYKVVDDNGNIIAYKPGKTENGFVYKDEEAYKTGKGICYIPELAFEDIEKEVAELRSQCMDSSASDEDYLEYLQDIFEQNGYTRQHFLDLWGGLEAFADDTFWGVTWEHPQTYVNDYDVDEECLRVLGITIEEFNKAVGYEYFKV